MDTHSPDQRGPVRQSHSAPVVARVPDDQSVRAPTHLAFYRGADTRVALALRLREERERLGFGVTELARQTLVSRECIRRYENGQSEIRAEFLAKTMPLGFDTQYILGGIRSSNMRAVIAFVEERSHD